MQANFQKNIKSMKRLQRVYAKRCPNVLLVFSFWALECVHSVPKSKRNVLFKLRLNR